MAETKFTQGPCRADGCYIAGPNGKSLGVAFHPQSRDGEVTGNANLWAAAPELYDAGLEVLMGTVSAAGFYDGEERVNLNISLSAFKALESALAKARGE